ncbi:MAG TPA: folylpolyglutamate synthase/dihydrofolate synthase family protein [Parasegetibacter sp.]
MFAKLPMFSRTGGAAYNKTLDNTIALCDYFQQPQHSFKSVHIAGTNGKGSVSHMIASVLQEAGYKTGLYTSPHLRDFRERIRVNGEMIPETFVTSFIHNAESIIGEINPSFFELTAVMAFVYFREVKVDIAIIETGMGGLLDSTNVVRPEVAVITNIGWDHTQFLGDTLEKIAGEKAGIIKSGIPAVIGETHPDTAGVFREKANLVQAPVIFADQVRKAQILNHNDRMLKILTGILSDGETSEYQLDLPGWYQARNLLTVLEALNQLRKRGFGISDRHIRDGLSSVRKNTGLSGRWELVKESPRVILDVAHNADGITQLRNQLEHTKYKQLHIVFGMVNDKDADAVLTLMPKNARYYFTRAQIPRALDENKLRTLGSSYQLTGDAYPTVMQALNAAVSAARADDLVLVCGSVFIVGEVEAEI